jgi:hypothetical protein
MIHYANLKKHSCLCCLLQAYLQFKDRITWTTFNKLIEDKLRNDALQGKRHQE